MNVKPYAEVLNSRYSAYQILPVRQSLMNRKSNTSENAPVSPIARPIRRENIDKCAISSIGLPQTIVASSRVFQLNSLGAASVEISTINIETAAPTRAAT